MEIPSRGYVLYHKNLKVYQGNGYGCINLYTNPEEVKSALASIAKPFRGDYEIIEVELKQVK